MTPTFLQYCPTCNQMTNHRDGVCLKHTDQIEKVIEIIIVEIRNHIATVGSHGGTFNKANPQIHDFLRNALTTLLQKEREAISHDILEMKNPCKMRTSFTLWTGWTGYEKCRSDATIKAKYRNV